VIVDFTVRHQDDRAVLIEERLRPSLEIDNAQAAHSQSHRALVECALAIGTTVYQTVIHAHDTADGVL
jgi:5-enolpyruvylshikimate-3-phosphate synthase